MDGINIGCFFVWQFMVHSMICMSRKPGYLYKYGYHDFPSKKFCLKEPKIFVKGYSWCLRGLACASHKLPFHASKYHAGENNEGN